MSDKPDMTEKQLGVIARASVCLMSLARNSLSPTQTKMATDSAGELLWVMGVQEYVLDGMTFKAKEPEGKIVDVKSTKLIQG